VNWYGPRGLGDAEFGGWQKSGVGRNGFTERSGSEVGGWLDVSFRAGGREVALEVDLLERMVGSPFCHLIILIAEGSGAPAVATILCKWYRDLRER
jgi:hypothetical protein